jgi:hypothetical protein
MGDHKSKVFLIELSHHTFFKEQQYCTVCTRIRQGSQPHIYVSKNNKGMVCTLGEVEFWIFWIFNFLQFAINGKNNSKTTVENVLFLIFMSSYAEMSFLK